MSPTPEQGEAWPGPGIDDLTQYVLDDRAAEGESSSDLPSHVGAGDPHPDYQLESEKGQANGYVGLNGSATIDSVYLPAFSGFETVSVANQAARLALATDPDTARLAIQADDDSKWIINAGDDPSVGANWIQFTFVAPVASITTEAGVQTGAVNLVGQYAPLVDGVVPEENSAAELLREATAEDTYATLAGHRAGTTVVLNSTAGAVELNMAGAAVGSLTLDENITSISITNDPLAGLLGIFRFQIHQAAAGGPFTVSAGALSGMGVDVWRNPEGAPTSMPATASAMLVIDLQVIEGVIYGEWSTPDVRFVSILVTDPNGSALTTGDGKAYWAVPAGLNGYRVAAVQADVTTVSSSGTPTIQLAEVVDGVDILSTRITIDASEKSSKDATAAPVVNAANAVLNTGNQVRVDVDVAGTGTKGLMVTLTLNGPPA